MSAPDHTESLDPQDWNEYRAILQALVDRGVDRLAAIGDRPWRPIDQHMLEAIAFGDANEGAIHLEREIIRRTTAQDVEAAIAAVRDCCRGLRVD